MNSQRLYAVGIVLLFYATMAYTQADNTAEGTSTEAAPTEAQSMGVEADDSMSENASSDATAQSDTAAPAVSSQAIINKQSEQQQLASRVMGLSVTNSENEEIAEITDLIMDDDNTVVGVVLSVGGFLGVGDKLIGVNWDQLQISESDGQKRGRVELSRDALEAAPNFLTLREQQAEQQAQQQQQKMQQELEAQQQQQQQTQPATSGEASNQ